MIAARWVRRRARERAWASADAEDRSAEALEAGAAGPLAEGAELVPAPLPGHLSPGLRRVFGGARTLALILDQPLRRAPDPLVRELPWVRRAHCDDWDLAVTDIRFAVWAWLKEVERLSEAERRRLGELGLSPGPFRRLLYVCLDRTDDPWEEVVWASVPDVDRVARELAAARLELLRFCQVLGGATVAPYRQLA